MLCSSLRKCSLSARYCDASDLISATAARSSCTCCFNSSTDCARAWAEGSEAATWAEAHEQPAMIASRKIGTISDRGQNLCCFKSSSRTEISAEPADWTLNHAGLAALACASAAAEDSSASAPLSREPSAAGWGMMMRNTVPSGDVRSRVTSPPWS